MTMTNHLVPPPELVKKIFGDALRGNSGQHDYELRLIHAAYAAGADQELEACCEWLARNYNYPRADHPLRIDRRPKPPSLKEQALDQLQALQQCGAGHRDTDKIRRALEALPDNTINQED